jgi:LPS export ABC transporter protein LptC
MVGDVAHVEPGGQVIDVTGNVRLQGEATGREGAAVIHTDALSYDVPGAVASTKSDVRIDFAQHTLTARGLIANLKERTLRLESKVNGRFHP